MIDSYVELVRRRLEDRLQDRVTVDGQAVSPPVGFTYYLLHKPEGFVTTAMDPEGRSTVLDLVPPRPRVFPVGRLDQETSGAILLTDDGPLAHRILHPRYGVEKEYTALVEGVVQEEALESLRSGVRLPGERHPTAPAQVEVIEVRPRRTRLRVIVHEGRKRQVRRMLETVGHPVIQLRRERVGPVSLGSLAPGTFRPLTSDEVEALRRETARKRRIPPRRRPTPGDTPHEPRTRAPRRSKPTS